MDSNKIKDSYIEYIKENTHVNLLEGDSQEVITPFVNTYGDGISFTIKYDGKYYILTDDGFTLWDLQLNGIDLTKKNKRHHLLKSILNYNGLELMGDDLSLLHPQTVQSHFLEDVKSYFNESSEYNVFPDLSIAGKSRLEHKFNFLAMSKGKYKLVQVHNKITKDKLHFILSSWLDTTENRTIRYGRNESLSIIISSDGYKELKDEYQEALNEYNINILNFEDKKKLKAQLGA